MKNSLLKHLIRRGGGTLAALLLMAGFLSCSPEPQEPVAGLAGVTLQVENMT